MSTPTGKRGAVVAHPVETPPSETFDHVFGTAAHVTTHTVRHSASSNTASEQEITLRIAFDDDERIAAFDAEYRSKSGAYSRATDAGMAEAAFLIGPYRVPAYRFRGRAWLTNPVGGRCAPCAIEPLVRETALDKAARELGLTPMEIRRRNLLSEIEMATGASHGATISGSAPPPSLEPLLGKLNVAEFREEQMAARICGRFLGLGIAIHATAAHACIVDVDRGTGFVTIKRGISSEDCGVGISPALDDGQIAGGLAQAIRSLLPAISDVRELEYVHTTAEGEGGITVYVSALINAIADAMAPFGALPESLPLTPAMLLAVMEPRD